jgi:hypothetical protein
MPGKIEAWTPWLNDVDLAIEWHFHSRLNFYFFYKGTHTPIFPVYIF